MDENEIQVALRNWVISQGGDPKFFNTPEGQQVLLEQIAAMTKGSNIAPQGIAAGNPLLLPKPTEFKSDTGTQYQVDPATGQYKTDKVPYTISSIQTGTHTQMPGAPSYPTMQGVVISDKDGRKFELSPDGNLQPYSPPGGGYSIQAPKERGIGDILTDLATRIPVEVARGALAAKDAVFGPPQESWFDLPNDPRGTQDPRNQRPYYPSATPEENALFAKMGVVPLGHENSQRMYGYKPWIPENTIQAQNKKYGGIMGMAGTGIVSRMLDRGTVNPLSTGEIGSNASQPYYGPNGLNQPAQNVVLPTSPTDGPFTGAGKSAVNNIASLLDFMTSPMAVGTFGLGAASSAAGSIQAGRTMPYLSPTGPVSSFSNWNNINRGIQAAASPNVVRGIQAGNLALQGDFAYGLGSHAIDSAKNVLSHTFGSGDQIPQPIYEPYSSEWYQQLGEHMQLTGDTNLQNPYTSLNQKSLGTAASSAVDAGLSGLFAGQIGSHVKQGGMQMLADNKVTPTSGIISNPTINNLVADQQRKASLGAAIELLNAKPNARQIATQQARGDDTFLNSGRIPENSLVIRAKPDESGVLQPSSYLDGVDPAVLAEMTKEEIAALRTKRLNELETEPLSPDSLEIQLERQKAQQEFRQFQEQMNLGDIVIDPRRSLAAAGGPVRGTGRPIKPKPIETNAKDTAATTGAPGAPAGAPAADAAQAQVRSGSQLQLGPDAAAAAAAAPAPAPVDYAAKIKGLQDELMAMVMDPTTPDKVVKAKRAELIAAGREKDAAAAAPVATADAAPVPAPAPAPAAAPVAAPASPLADLAAEALPKPKTKPKTKPKAPDVAAPDAAAQAAAPAAAPVAADAAAVDTTTPATKPAGTPAAPKDGGPKKQVYFDEAVMPEQTDADKAIYGRDMPRSFPIPAGNEGKNFKFMVYDRRTKAQQWIEADNPMNFNQAREKAIEQYGESAVVIPMRRIVPEGFKVTDRKVRSESPYVGKPKPEPKAPRIPEDQRAPQIPPREAPKRDAAALLEQVKDPRRLSYDELVELSNQGNQVAKDELASRQRQVTGDKADRSAVRKDGLKPTVETADQLLKRIKDIPKEIEALQAEASDINRQAIKLGIRSNTPEGLKQMADKKNFTNGRTLAEVRREIERKRNAWSAAKSELNARTRQQQGWIDVRGKQTLKSNTPNLDKADKSGVSEEGAPATPTPAGFRQGDMPRISGPHALRQHKGDISRLTNDQLAEVQKDLTSRGHTAKDKSDEGKTLRKINNALDRRALSAKKDETLMSREDLEMRRDSIPDELAAKRKELALGMDKLSGPEKSKIIEKIKDLEAEKSRVDSELGYRKRKESARRSTYDGESNPGGKEGTVPVPDKAPKDEPGKQPGAPAEAEARDAQGRTAAEAAEFERQAEETRRQEEEAAATEAEARRQEEAAAEETRRQEEESRRQEEEDAREEFRSSVEEQTEAIENLDNLTQAVQKQVFGTKKNPGVVQKLREATEAWENAKTPAERRAAMDKVEEQLSELETIRDEMQEKQDNTHENFQETEVYQNREEAISALDDAISSLRDTLDTHESAGRDFTEGGDVNAPKSMSRSERDFVERSKNREIPQKNQPGRWENQGKSKLDQANEDVQRTTDMYREAEAAVEKARKSRGYADLDLVSTAVEAYKRMQRAKERLDAVTNEGFDPNAPKSPLKNGELSARETKFDLMSDQELMDHYVKYEDRVDGANEHGWADTRSDDAHMRAAVREMQKRNGIADPKKALEDFEKRFDPYGFDEKNQVDAPSVVSEIVSRGQSRGGIVSSNGLRDVLGKYYDKTGVKLVAKVEGLESNPNAFVITLERDGAPGYSVASATFNIDARGNVLVDNLDTSHDFRKNGFATGLIAEGLRSTGEQLVKRGVKDMRRVNLFDASEGGASGRALENVVGRTRGEEALSDEMSTPVEGDFDPTKPYSKKNNGPDWAKKKSTSQDYFAFESQFESLPDGVRDVVKDVMKGAASVESVLEQIVNKVDMKGTGMDSSMARYAKFLLKNADVRSLGKVFKAESLLSQAKDSMGGSSLYSPASVRGGLKEGGVVMAMKQLTDPANALTTIMHEITHATTHAKINRALFGKSNAFSLKGGTQGTAYLDKIKALVKDPNSDRGVRAIARAYLKYLEKAEGKRPINLKKIEEAAQRGEELIGDAATPDMVQNSLAEGNNYQGQASQYGAINLHEFAAEVMTDRNFQYELSKIQTNERFTVMDMFRRGVMDILGANKDMAESRLLGQAMDSVLKIAKTEHSAITAPGTTYYNILRDGLIERKQNDGTFKGMSMEEMVKAADEMMMPERLGGKDVYDIEGDQSPVGRTLADIDADISQLKADRSAIDMERVTESDYQKRLKKLEFERKNMEGAYESKTRGDKALEAEAVRNLDQMGVSKPNFDQVTTEMERIKDRRQTEDYEPRNLERDRKAFEKGKTEEELMQDLGEGYDTQERKMDELRNELDMENADRDSQTGETKPPYEEWSEQSDLGDDYYNEPNSPKSVRRVVAEEVRANLNAAEDFKDFVKNLDSNNGDPRGVLKKWGNRTTDILTVSTLQASQGQLLKVAERYNSPAVMQISGLINGVLAGRTEGVKDLGFHGEVSTNNLRFSNKLSDTIRGFEDQLKLLPTSQQRALLEALGSDVTRPGLPADPKQAKAVKQIRELYKELFYYQKRAGVKLDWAGDTYIPRTLDNTKVLADRDGFISAASDAYVMSGLKRAEADAAAREWYQNILMGDSGFSYSEGSFIFDSGNMNGEPKHTRSRKFDKFADKVLEKYYNRNILDVTQAYIGRAVRNAELARRFGHDFGKYQALQKRIIFGEKNQKILREVNENVAAQLGAYGGGGSLKNASNIVNSYTAISMLPRATFSSLSEPVVMAMRSGRMLDVFKAYKDSAIQFGRQLADLPPDYQTKLAEDIGVVAAAAVTGYTSSSVTNRFMGDGVNSAAGKITSQFFRRTGLHQYTEGTRVAAVAMGETFLRRLARDVNEGRSIKQSSMRYLKELGVTDIDGFSKFVESLQKMDENTRLKAITGNRSGKAQREYRNALVKFAEQSIMNPNAGTRPRWAAHPIGAMCYNLQSYLGAFHENVTKRVIRTTLDAANLKNGLTFNDRVRMLGPLATFPVLFYASYGLNNIVRPELFTDPSRRFDEPDSQGMKDLRAFSRSNMLGRYDALVNLATSAKYDKDPATALIGPGLGVLSEGIKGGVDYFSDKNSENTNTAERRAHRLLYDIAIKPPMNALMSVGGVGRLGGLIGAAGIQATSHPALRENYVERAAGPPVDPKNRPAKENFLDQFYSGQ